MADICHPKKLRLAGADAASSATAAAAADQAAAAEAERLLAELRRKCACGLCGQPAESPMAAKCGHCVCEKCAEELRRSAGVGAGADAKCSVCQEAVRPDDLKRDYATGKLLNAMQVLQEHIRTQETQPSLERARCADCLRSANNSEGGAGGDNNAEAVAKRCQSLGRQLDELLEAGERQQAERRRLLAEAAGDLDALRDQLARQLEERHQTARQELEQMRHTAERLLAEETSRYAEARLAGAELRRLLLPQSAAAAAAAAAAAGEASTEPLRSAESRVSELVRRLKADSVSGGFELARRSEGDSLTTGFAALLRQLGVDLVVRPYPAIGPDTRPVRVHRTGVLEPWDFGLLANVAGLWRTPDGEVRRQPEDEPAVPESWQPLPSPCLIVNYKGYKTKRLHLFDSGLNEVASVSLQLKEGRLPGTIYVCNQRQRLLSVDHGKGKICQFDITGRLVKKLGSCGTGPSQFRQPMTAWVDGDTLYVVDSDNKKVKLFNMDSLEPCGCLSHDGFSSDIHSVLVSESRIIVTDRDNSKAFVFDKQSQALLRETSLAGKPFSLAQDAEGNLFVSLTNERKVQIYDAAFAHRLHSLTVVRHHRRRGGAGGTSGATAAAADAAAGGTDVDDDDDDSSSSSDGGGGILAGLKLGGSRGKPPFIYGIAFDSVAKRLFVADTFCHTIQAYQL